MDSTEKMYASVRRAKSQAEIAEDNYNDRVDELNYKTSRNIDLFGGTAVSQVADIASSAKKCTDELYATYQTLVTVLDEECRPLLSSNPNPYAIKQVAELIKWLNDESEISANFTGSFNGDSLGEFANVKYTPSLENKCIESYWNSKLNKAMDEDPKYIDKMENEKNRIAQEEKKHREAEIREQEIRKAKEQEEAKAEEKRKQQEIKEWEKKVEEIKQKRRCEEEPKIDQIKKETVEKKADVLRKRDEKLSAIRKDEERLKAQINSDSIELSGLGLFNFSNKKRLKTLIETNTSRLSSLENEKSGVLNRYQTDIDVIDKDEKKALSALENELNKKYMLPKCPEVIRTQKEKQLKNTNSKMTATQKENLFIKEMIMDVLSFNGSCTITEIQNKSNELSRYSNQRVAAILRQMVESGEVKKTVTNHKSYFEIGICDNSKEKREIGYSTTENERPYITKTQMENERLKKKILDAVSVCGPSTVTEIHDNNYELSQYSTQRISALLRQLVQEGTVTKTVSKKIAYFEVK